MTNSFTDQQNPMITCPSDMTVSSSQVTWQNPVSTDNFDMQPDISCSPSSNSMFAVGMTTPVTCMATDNAGNTATCTFSVTVGKNYC